MSTDHLSRSHFARMACTFQNQVIFASRMPLRKHSHNACPLRDHYIDVIMSAMASQVTSLTVVYSTVYSDADQKKYQSSASLVPVNSPHKGPVTRKMFPFDDVIMIGSWKTDQWPWYMPVGGWSFPGRRDPETKPRTNTHNREVSLHVKRERVRVERDRRAWRHQNMCTLWHCSREATRHTSWF